MTHTFPAEVLKPYADFVIGSLNELLIARRGAGIGR